MSCNYCNDTECDVFCDCDCHKGNGGSAAFCLTKKIIQSYKH